MNQELELTIKDHYQNRPSFLKRAWAWVKSHVGTELFNNCKGKNPCGPCAGICLRFKPTINSPILEGFSIEGDELIVSDEEYEEGFRPYQLSIIENIDTTELFLQFEFKPEDIHDVAYNESFVIAEDTLLSEEICSMLGVDELGLDSILIKEGVYPFTFDSETNFYYVIVEFEQ